MPSRNTSQLFRDWQVHPFWRTGMIIGCPLCICGRITNEILICIWEIQRTIGSRTLIYYYGVSDHADREESTWGKIKMRLTSRTNLPDAVSTVMTYHKEKFTNLLSDLDIRSVSQDSYPGLDLFLVDAMGVLMKYPLQKMISEFKILVGAMESRVYGFKKCGTNIEVTTSTTGATRVVCCTDLRLSKSCSCTTFVTTCIPCRHMMYVALHVFQRSSYPIDEISIRWKWEHILKTMRGFVAQTKCEQVSQRSHKPSVRPSSQNHDHSATNELFMFISEYSKDLKNDVYAGRIQRLLGCIKHWLEKDGKDSSCLSWDYYRKCMVSLNAPDKYNTPDKRFSHVRRILDWLNDYLRDIPAPTTSARVRSVAKVLEEWLCEDLQDRSCASWIRFRDLTSGERFDTDTANTHALKESFTHIRIEETVKLPRKDCRMRGIHQKKRSMFSKMRLRRQRKAKLSGSISAAELLTGLNSNDNKLCMDSYNLAIDSNRYPRRNFERKIPRVIPDRAGKHQRPSNCFHLLEVATLVKAVKKVKALGTDLTPYDAKRLRLPNGTFVPVETRSIRFNIPGNPIYHSYVTIFTCIYVVLVGRRCCAWRLYTIGYLY